MKSPKIVLSPDSFKGCLSSVEVCSAMRQGVVSVIPDANVLDLPLGDGGEGTLDICRQHLGGELVSSQVHDPYGKRVISSLLITDDDEAVIESAEACGLTLVGGFENTILNSTTIGVGELILNSLKKGVRKITVFLGGSATNDGGLGMLQVLGYRFYDSDCNELEPIAGNLSKIDSISDDNVNKLLKNVEISVCADVENPLLGEKGCSHVFARQKGADDREIEILEKGMENFAEKAKRFFNADWASFPGAGAAGGLGFAFKSFLGANIQSGIDFMLDMMDFDSALEDSSLVLTGEGSIDRQSLMGKAVSGLLNRCLAKGIPLVALGGKVENIKDLNKAGLTAVFPISGPGKDLNKLMERHSAYNNIKETTIQVMRLMQRTVMKS